MSSSPPVRHLARRAAPPLAIASLAVVLIVVAQALAAPMLRTKAPPSAGPSSGDAKSEAEGKGGSAYESVTSLLDHVQNARIDMPAREAGLGVLSGYWRKIRAPWAAITGDRQRLVLSLALRTTDGETQWAAPAGSGKVWKPDARVWNMNEGSYDQREALVVVSPGVIAFKVEIPRGGALSFAPGTVHRGDDDAVFGVRVRDGQGRTHSVFEKTIVRADQGKWGDDVVVDLAAFAGQTVELELVTTTVSSGAPPKPDAPPVVGLFAHPTLLARRPTEVPYNVLFIVVDALRPDVLASFHEDAEDARKAAARPAPLEAWLPKMPGLTPNLDALAEESLRFVHAYSAASWTRPGTLAMLAGKRSSELGISAFDWIVPAESAARFYASSPPLLPLLLRRHGVVTRAFVNNYFMTGYAPIGVDMGFERVSDHRYRTHDTQAITDDTVRWLEQNGANTRFFAFCNYNSPHEPFEPPAEMEARLPKPSPSLKDEKTRKYAAEAGKDDAAIGVLLRTLTKIGALDRTIVVVTADHGETLSAAHAGRGLENLPVRFHHAASNYEETTRIPLLIRVPKLAPRIVRERVRNVDIAPTLLELLGIDVPKTMRGMTLVPLVRGETESSPRVVVSEGRGSRAIFYGRHRLILRDPKAPITIEGADGLPVRVAEELFDLDADPGERVNLAGSHPDLVAELRARLAAEERGVAAADANATLPLAGSDPRANSGVVHLRFAGGGGIHRVSGRITSRSKLTATPVNLGAENLRAIDGGVELAATTSADGIVGLDVRADDQAAEVGWELYWDDRPLSEADVFAGEFGVADSSLVRGIQTASARKTAAGRALPFLDPKRDRGLFVLRNADGEGGPSPELSGEGAEEMGKLLKEWGYANGSK